MYKVPGTIRFTLGYRIGTWLKDFGENFKRPFAKRFGYILRKHIPRSHK